MIINALDIFSQSLHLLVVDEISCSMCDTRRSGAIIIVSVISLKATSRLLTSDQHMVRYSDSTTTMT